MGTSSRWAAACIERRNTSSVEIGTIGDYTMRSDVSTDRFVAAERDAMTVALSVSTRTLVARAGVTT